MKLYHYTSATLLEAILDDALNNGLLKLPDGRLSEGIVWLTHDPLPYNHGLLDGTPLDEKGMASATQLVGKRPLNPATHDKRQVRITIDSDALDEGWMPFVEWAKAIGASSDYIRGMGLSAIDGIAAMDDKTFLAAVKNGVSREGTWYLVPNSISPARFESIEALVAGSYVPYAFEAHGRETLAKHGIVYPDAALLERLPSVGQPQHPFDRMTVCAFAPSASSTSHVRFRGFGQATIVELHCDGAMHAMGAARGDEILLRAWAYENLEAMMMLWEEAVAAARAYGKY